MSGRYFAAEFEGQVPPPDIENGVWQWQWVENCCDDEVVGRLIRKLGGRNTLMEVYPIIVEGE